jgi:hypothetical protein
MGKSILEYLKKYWLRFVIVIAAILIFLLAHNYYVHELEKDGRPIQEDVDISGVPNINQYRYYIESLTLFDERNYIYNLSGWAFSTQNPADPTDQFNTQILLISEEDSFLFDASLVERDDVVQAFTDLDLEIRRPGFSALINNHLLPREEYCIGIIFTDDDGEMLQGVNTGQILIRDAGSLVLAQDEEFKCNQIFPEGAPTQTNVRLPEVSEQNKYFIDALTRVEGQTNLYDLNGWAFSTENPNEPTNIFLTDIILFNETQNFVLNTLPNARGDVVDAFTDLGLDIVDPGYSARVNNTLIPPGDYCIGIRLTHLEGTSAQFINTLRVITIDENGMILEDGQQEICVQYYNNNVE